MADVVFSAEAAGRPAYLDLEDDVLCSIRDSAEPAASDPAAGLISAVKGVLGLTKGSSQLLAAIQFNLLSWERDEKLEPPPTLAFLALLSLAAEQMHHGDGQAANNFYGRLAQLLDLNDRQKQWFIEAYRKPMHGGPCSERLWSSLNVWLERHEGNRGLPTAYSDSHAHVGLPLSQALVRRTDRDKLKGMFALYGLAPHSALPAPEMEELIAEWVTRVPCPASNALERMWRRDRTARGRIIDVARLALETWDGTGEDGLPAPMDGGRQIDSVRAKALLRTFPARRLELGLLVAAPAGSTQESVAVIGPDNEPLGEIDLVPSASGWLSLADPSEIDVASFLRGETRLRRSGSHAVLRRRPRRLVPLRHDDLLQAFVECERIGLGEDALLLARAEIAENVGRLLHTAARPGFSQLDSIDGLPDGWVLFDNVQILSSIPADLLRNQLVDLNVLQPLASSQVVLQGGLRLPGNIRKWCSARAPELRVTSDGASHLSARLSCIRPLTSPTPTERAAASDQPVLVWDLSVEELPDGDYEITVTSDGDVLGRPEVVRLRSADHPSLVLDDGLPTLRHDPLASRFGLHAERCPEDRGFQCVPMTPACSAAHQAADAFVPEWYSARKSRPADTGTRPVVQFPAPTEGSCMLTGQHYMLIERAGSASTVEGVCKGCGLVKRYPTRFRLKKAQPAAGKQPVAPRVNLSGIDSIKETSRIDWSLGFDALCHIGGGRTAHLEQIALQMEPSGLFGDTFARRLEALGHIELERDPQTLALVGWEIVDPVLAGTHDGQLIVIGFRNERMMVALEDAAWQLKAELIVDAKDQAPARVRIATDHPEAVDRLSQSITTATGKGTRFVPDAAEALAACLPPFSRVVASLPTTSTASARGIERWDPVTARFIPVADSGSPGAYRLKGFTRTYVYRREAQIGTMQATIGDARVVKFAAALDHRGSLVGYDAAARVLYAPLGADLPGLYGRAAVLASGRPPFENIEERLLEYRNVPAQLAGRLCELLST